MRVTIPSSGCGTFKTHKMTRISGNGLEGAILAESKQSKSDAPILGKGGSFLLDGGMGGQSSYPSIAEYTATTGRVIRKGSGLEKITTKLNNLNLKTKKNNIKFEM